MLHLKKKPLHRTRGGVMRESALLVRQKLPFTIRGEVPLSDFPRQYRAESLDISLHLSRSSSGSYMLLGILTSRNANEGIDSFEGVNAELYAAPGPLGTSGDKRAEKPLLSTTIDNLGHIVFLDVPEGEYVMFLLLPGLEVIVEGLTIR
jgi:hypothetical protein